jgi:DNA polymerase-1
MTTALIDGDVFAYRVAAASETVIEWANGQTTFEADIDEAKAALDATIQDLADGLGAKRTLVALSVSRCFRYDVLPTYKHNRRDVRKPVLLRGLKEHLTNDWNAKSKPKLEADDVIGIWATMPTLKGRKVVVSIDKDFKQIPGYFFNPDKDEAPVKITETQADYWHMMQTLMGDTTDGYKGCPGIGPKKANAIYERACGYEPTDRVASVAEVVWPFVVEAFEAKELTEADALQQARVARICRHSDFDTVKQEPILWTPPN